MKKTYALEDEKNVGQNGPRHDVYQLTVEEDFVSLGLVFDLTEFHDLIVLLT